MAIPFTVYIPSQQGQVLTEESVPKIYLPNDAPYLFTALVAATERDATVLAESLVSVSDSALEVYTDAQEVTQVQYDESSMFWMVKLYANNQFQLD